MPDPMPLLQKFWLCLGGLGAVMLLGGLWFDVALMPTIGFLVLFGAAFGAFES